MPLDKGFNIQQINERNDTSSQPPGVPNSSTSVDSTEMKKYRNGRKQVVSPTLERGMGCGILGTQLWHQPIVIPQKNVVGI